MHTTNHVKHMKRKYKLVLAGGAIATIAAASPAQAKSNLPFPEDPAPSPPAQNQPKQPISYSASDLKQGQYSEVSGDAYSESTSVNQAAYYNRNVQNNYSSSPSYTQIDNIRYETPAIYVEGGYGGVTGYGHQDYSVRVGVRIPLGGRLAKRIAKKREQRELEKHCIALAQSGPGWITDECANSGLRQIARAHPPAPKVIKQEPPAPKVVPVKAPPNRGVCTSNCAPVPGMW